MASARAATSTGARARNSPASSRSPQAMPISRASARGRNNASAAGRKPSVQAKAISMPTPAISPSSATPRKSVGTKARKPQAVAAAATSICGPTRAAVTASAVCRLSVCSRISRRRTQNWMAKSTAMPTNRMAKATETRFSVPTASAAKPVVSDSPSAKVSRIGTISRQERTASTSHSVTSSRLPMMPATAPCATEANSSSASATDPVMRTLA